jgi:hypothetical protein
MASKVRFSTAADNTRPYKSHRYEVFSLKLARKISLFGQTPLNAWIALEADPAVVSYCERPLVIPDIKPKRVVDFWVGYRDREELWVLQRPSSHDGLADPMTEIPAFATWASSQRMPVRFIEPADPVTQRTYLDNWGRIIRDLSANRKYVPASLLERVRASFTGPRPLSTLPGLFPDDDPVLLRTAAYALIHNGSLRCADIDQTSLGPTTLLEAK